MTRPKKSARRSRRLNFNSNTELERGEVKEVSEIELEDNTLTNQEIVHPRETLDLRGHSVQNDHNIEKGPQKGKCPEERQILDPIGVLGNDGLYYPCCSAKTIEKEKALGDEIQITDIMDEVAGVYPKIMQEGTMDAGAWSCGMVAGLIHDIPTCKELVERIVSDAEAIIKSRLSQFVA